MTRHERVSCFLLISFKFDVYLFLLLLQRWRQVLDTRKHDVKLMLRAEDANRTRVLAKAMRGLHEVIESTKFGGSPFIFIFVFS